MRVFTELFIDELRILVADKDYDVDVEVYPAGHPEGYPDHGFVFASAQLSNYLHVYGLGQTAEEALRELQSFVISMYELCMEDLPHIDNLDGKYQQEVYWWCDHWSYTKTYVPDRVADVEMSSHERWEEWQRRFEPSHIRFLVTDEFDDEEEEDATYTRKSGRKTKLTWL